MARPICTPESFIESLNSKLASLTSPLPPGQPSNQPASSPSSRPPPPFNLSTLSLSPSSSPQSFSSFLSILPKQKQEEITHLLTTFHFIFPHELIPALDLLDRRLVTRMAVKPSSPTAQAAAAATAVSAEDAAAREEREMEWAEKDVHQRVTGAPMPVSKYGAEISTSRHADTDTAVSDPAGTENEIFYVQSTSSQATTSTSGTARRRRHHANESTHYEVRLSAWNCTCPVFAVSAFDQSSLASDSHADVDGDEDSDDGDNGEQREPAQQPHQDEHGTEKADISEPGLNVNAQWRFGGTLTRTRTPSACAPAAAAVAVPVCKHILAVVLSKHVPNPFGSGVRLSVVGPEEGAGWAGGWGD